MNFDATAHIGHVDALAILRGIDGGVRGLHEARMTDIASQLMRHSVKLSTEDWKLLFMDALNQEMRLVPNINGNGFVNLGRSSSSLSKAEFSNVIDLVHEFGARRDVVFHDPESRS
ncbi:MULTISPECIES: recombination protein NinB [Bradyrhizobium]|uniref:Uncharacterized protein n=1 Tax=Bradyrhizobium elkanii TaxID=29448 RepID=A0A8I1Y6R5_BRAEL|nr:MULTISPECIES: recombination protein NinB [Bradyrhizobium]MBP1295759.1 hypothetical protein [Bradyrhizobium elkanii]MCP1933342.1 hypothetical protein [Bradyrhizobium elkanii]MCS3478649.1 hypothetical protein [Bradyrhizobium elkanii]MCS3585421.1 hypothetical protein [Bradyrhizobium elkanii]MCS3718996.1 hypothetical protein [Bradyrhizobium elkanii]